jgi:hypothetical protein
MHKLTEWFLVGLATLNDRYWSMREQYDDLRTRLYQLHCQRHEPSSRPIGFMRESFELSEFETGQQPKH